MSNATISIDIKAQTATLQKGLNDAKQAISGLDAGMAAHVAKGMAMFTAGLAGVQAALAAVRGAFNSVMGAMDEMDRQAKFASRLGTTADALQVLGFAAEQSGASQDVLNLALEKMQNLLGEASAGSTVAQQAFANLGLSVQDLQGLRTDEVFAKVAEQLQLVDDASMRTKIALDLFGKSGGQLLPLLLSGAEGLNAFGAEAESMGLLLGDNRAAVEAANDAINKMKRSWGAFVQQVAVLVAPAIKAIADALSSVVGWFNQLMGRSTGAAAPFQAFGTEAKKAAFTVEKSLKRTEETAAKAADKIKETWRDVPKPLDYKTPGVGAATRGTVAGFSALQEAQRAAADAERRHRESVNWLRKIHEATVAGRITVEPVGI